MPWRFYLQGILIYINIILGRDKIDIGLGRIYTYFTALIPAICDSLSLFSLQGKRCPQVENNHVFTLSYSSFFFILTFFTTWLWSGFYIIQNGKHHIAILFTVSTVINLHRLWLHYIFVGKAWRWTTRTKTCASFVLTKLPFFVCHARPVYVETVYLYTSKWNPGILTKLSLPTRKVK